MSKKASKTLIGTFVLGALVLIVAGVVIFGGGKFFKKTVKFVMFFNGSVKGLQVGAPVTFRGVKIGEVTDIVLHASFKDLTVLIPVYIEIDPQTFRTDIKARKKYQYTQAMIDRGLKGRLEMQSFVTGQLMIGLDFYPDKPIHLVGLDKKYPEIPTIPTTMEELTKTLQELPIKQITQKLDSVLEGMNEIVHSPDLRGSIASMNVMLKDIDMLTKNIDTRLEPLAASMTSTSDAARSALVQAEKTLKMEEGRPGEIASEIRDALKASRVTLEEARQAMQSIKLIAAQNVNVGYDINRSLEQMTALSRSLRSLTDYLDRHPEALIRGKYHSEGD